MKTKIESYIVLTKLFRVTYDDEVIEAVSEDLEGVTDEEFAAVCKRARKAYKFMPSVCELLEMVEEHRETHPQPRKRSPRMQRHEAIAEARRIDRGELGLETEEQYEQYMKDWEKENGEPYELPYFHPEQWYEDGTPKGFEEEDAESAV